MTLPRSISRNLKLALPFLALASCDSAGEPRDDSAIVRSDRARISSPQVKDEDLAQAVAGNTAFAVDLYQAIRTEPGNLFFSPHSISTALAMTYAGAEGSTETQMKDTLHFGVAEPALHAAFNKLDLALSSRGENAEATDGKAFRLRITNAIWGQKDYTFLPTFLDALAENYGAGLRVLDFQNAAESARQTINGWVEDETEGKIKDLLPERSIRNSTRLVLTNAIYFNAAWRDPFPEDATQPGTFHLVDGGQVSVPMMKQDSRVYRYDAGDGYQAVELPYDGNELSMVVMVPDEGTFGDFEAAWNTDKISAVLDRLGGAEVTLTMPKFRFEFPLGLKEVLMGMGMADAFEGLSADFSGINGRRDLYISDVLHKAFVAVDEKGTEAAAATAVIVGEVSLPPGPFTVVLDRPFLFLIRDLQTGAILFVGRVVNPA